MSCGPMDWNLPILFKAVCVNASDRTVCPVNDIVWVVKFSKLETVYGVASAGWNSPKGRTLVGLPTFEFLDCFIPADPRDIIKFRDVLKEYKDISYKAWQDETADQVKLAIGHDRPTASIESPETLI